MTTEELAFIYGACHFCRHRLITCEIYDYDHRATTRLMFEDLGKVIAIIDKERGDD